MNKINVLIVEDNPIIAESISVLLAKHGLHVLDVIESGEAAIDAVEKHTPDLILMDVQLAGAMDGVSTAQLIRSKLGDVPIIYLTDFSDERTVERAKKTFPSNYLTKPFNESELIRAIDIAFHNHNHEKSPTRKGESAVFVRTDTQKYEKLNLNDILYLEAGRSYCKIVFDSGEHLISTSMNHILEQIEDDRFVRVHRSYVVNVRKISQIDGNVILLGSKEIQMGKEFRDNLWEKVKVIR